MSTSSKQWHSAVAARFHAPKSLTRDLIKIGELPTADEFRALIGVTGSFPLDEPARAALDAYRSLFDTPPAPFIDDLIALVTRAAHDLPEQVAPRLRLVEFRHWAHGETPSGYYPLTPVGGAWLGHRVSVTRAELDAAGYPALARSWGYARTHKAYGYVPWGGEVPLRPIDIYFSSTAEARWRVPQAKFLAQLLNVIGKRPPAAAAPTRAERDAQATKNYKAAHERAELMQKD